MKKLILLSLMAIITIACKKNSNTVIRVTGEPVISFQFTGKQMAPATIIFSNDSRNATRYHWDFGNGQTSDKQIPEAIKYIEAGTYDVILTAANDEKTAILKKTILITDNADPQARFSYTFKDQRSAAPATVLLSNESVNAITYEWDINGYIYTEKTPQNIVFNQPGTYPIKLKAIKNGINSAVYQQDVTVLRNPNPIARFQLAYHPYPYIVGEEIQLVNQSENSDAWLWTFGTNGPPQSTEQHPLVKYMAPGTYTIKLVAKKGAAVSPEKSINITIEP